MSVNHNTVWKNCLNLIQENISEQGFKTWFKPIVPIRFEDQVLTIQVPNQYIYEMLEDQFIGILKRQLNQP